MPDAVQDRELVFALDIGTRSIVGVLGREEGGRFRVLDIEKEEHGRRAMLDGQIEDIAQVAAIAGSVIARLESRQRVRLKKVCVAAAGRALQSARASFTLEFSEPKQADDETVNQLEAGAVSAAESFVADGGDGTFYMVGYTASQYRLDGYPMSTLQGHRGRVMEADVVATFLPREVVDSLYTVVARLGLEVSSLTLEPIASLNAAIPVDIRLLNLVLVDIGAGTSDIAVCRDGSVAGYTMATVAGDEVTELLMKKLLVDFRTAEQLKMSIGQKEPLRYTDILGLGHECTSEMLAELIDPAVKLLASEIAGKVLELNGSVPSAVFLAGGGSKLHGLRQAVASEIGMDEVRVAIAGNHFERNAFAEGIDLNDPEFSTPLGIAVSAALGMINDSYVVTLNGAPAKLFRSGKLSIRDVLLMNGCKYGDMIGRTGANLTYTLNGARQFVRGTHGTPPVILLNGAAAELSALVHAGDNVEFTPAKAGQNAMRTLAEALGEGFADGVSVNGKAARLSYRLNTGDVIETGSDQPVPLEEEDTVPAPAVPEKREEVRRYAAVYQDGSGEREKKPVLPAEKPLEGQLAFDGAPSPGHRVPPVAAARQVEAVPPVVPARPVETVPPVAAAGPVEAVPPVAPARPVETVAPMAPARPVETVPPVAAGKPVEAVPPVTAGKPAETVPPVAPARPVKPVLPEAAQKPQPPKRRGVPRVVLPDLPGFRQQPVPPRALNIRLNGKPFALPPKAEGEPHYFMDVLQYSGLDFNHLERPVELLCNGAPCEFTQMLAENDDVVVRYQE